MHEIRIANARDYLKDGKLTLPENAVYVGRRVNRYRLKPSPLGSPWKVGELYVYGGFKPYRMFDGREVAVPRGRLTREDVVSLTRLSLQQSIGTKEQSVLDELTRLRALAEEGPLTLICWCFPKPCHANVIREYLLGEAK